jgi:2-desacetyl-2-hydroxyethyl bacteriochlorophyllide A dehydrogenase
LFFNIMTSSQRVVFTAPFQAELEEFELERAPLQPGEILLHTECSIISAGTEGAAYNGLEAEHPYHAVRPHFPDFSYPTYPGYGNIGEIIEAGHDVQEYAVGDRVFTSAPHASHARYNTRNLCVKVPDELGSQTAAFVCMGNISITALRMADFSPGDKVLILGLGMVGNLAAQLFAIGGANVLAVDIAPSRLEKAKQCSIAHVLDPQREDLGEAVREWTKDKGARIVVEAVGQPRLIEQGAQLAARHGDLILLGSPRRRVTMDVTPLLTAIHLQGLKVKGALQWLYPLDNCEGAHHTIRENVRQIFDWMKTGKLVTEPLLTHLLSPSQCQQAYNGLENHKDEYLGVVFDWR